MEILEGLFAGFIEMYFFLIEELVLDNKHMQKVHIAFKIPLVILVVIAWTAVGFGVFILFAVGGISLFVEHKLWAIFLLILGILLIVVLCIVGYKTEKKKEKEAQQRLLEDIQSEE